MTELLFQKLQRLKEEVVYLKDNRERFLSTLKTSADTRKIVERSVFLTAEMVLDEFKMERFYLKATCVSRLSHCKELMSRRLAFFCTGILCNAPLKNR